MEEFFNFQLDYIYFFYGLSFIIMAQACLGMRKPARQGLPWIWLALFGITHGLNEWADLLGFSITSNSALDIIRLSLLVVSFVFLVEFGRTGSAAVSGRGAGRWVVAALVVLSLTGLVEGVPGFTATSRYALGLTGGIWACSVLFRASKKPGFEHGGWLVPAAAAIGLYGIFTGLVVPKAGFFPASIVNYETFSHSFGFPVQLARASCALVAAVSITAYARAACRSDSASDATAAKPSCSAWPVPVLLAVVVLGWLMTDAVGDTAEETARQSLLARTLTAASVIDPARVAALSGTPADVGSEEFARIREHLSVIRSANPDCRFVYLMAARGDKMIFLADAEREDSKDYSPPGSVYEETKPSDIEDYKNARSLVYGPFTDAWGRWVTGVAPILDPATGRVLAQLGMDVDADEWIRSISEHRLFSILGTLALCVLSIAFFMAWQRSREVSAQRSTLQLAGVRLENEKKLRDIAASLGEGLIVIDDRGGLTFMNPEAERLLGWTERELFGRNMFDVVRFRRADGRVGTRDECLVIKTLMTGISHRDEGISFTRRDGTTFPVSYVSNAIMEAGQPVGAVTAFQDITERRTAEQLIRESEEKYKNLVELTSDIIYISDTQGNQVYMNDAGFIALEYSPREVLGQPWTKLVHPDDRERTRERFAEMVDKGLDVFNFENRFVSKTGRVINSLHNVRVLRDSTGKVVGTQGIARDITERKKTEEVLRESEEKFRGLAEKSPNMIFINRGGRVVYANEMTEEIMGYRRDEIISPGFDFRTLIAPESRGLVEDNFRRHMAGEEVEPYEYALITRDGRRIDAIIATRLIKFEGDRAILGIVTDITGRKRTEQELRKLTQAFDQSASMLIISDAGGKIEYVNPAFTRITGFGFDEIVGTSVNALGEQPPDEYERMWNTLSGGGEWRGEFYNWKKNGERHWVSASIAPVRDDEGRITSYVSVQDDLTDRKQAEESIQRSLREKEVLLSEIHHRVKNNLQVIYSLLKLQSKLVGDKRSEEIFRDSMNRIKTMALIHERLYLSKDLGNINLSTYIRELARDLFRSYAADTARVGLKVETGDVKLGLDTAIPCGLIINELVSNSLKYAFPDGRQGTISINFSPGASGGYELSVEDDGVGMPEGMNPNGPSGTLGLHLVSILVEDQLRGSLRIDRNGGTKFHIAFKEVQ